MKVIALDLEMNQPSGNIIQIGAAIGDVETGVVIDTFSVFINPEEELSERITDLTGISQAEVDSGVSLLDGYLMLREFKARHEDCFINPIEWNGGDSFLLRQQLLVQNPNIENFYKWIFGRRYLDAKTLYQAYRMINGHKMQGGLAKAMTKFNLAFKGKKHNAMDDAVNTFRIYHALVQKLKEKDACDKMDE